MELKQWDTICPVCNRICGYMGLCEVCRRSMGVKHMYIRKTRSVDDDPTPIAHYTCQDCDGTAIDAFYTPDFVPVNTSQRKDTSTMNVRSWLASKVVPGAAASAPMVNGETFEDDIPDEPTLPQQNKHLERYRTLIDSFDEDRETFLEKVIRWLLLLLAYALPIIVAYAMGKEIGDAYGGKFDMNDGWSLGTHVVAMAGEFALTMMTFSAASALRKSATDKSYTSKFISSVVAFLLFAIASGLAQWFIASGHIKTVDLTGHANISGFAALIFRVAMVPGVDVAALLFLAVMNFKSLKKFVADQRIRAQAIRDLNEAELEIQRAQSTARRRESEEQQDIEMKEQRNGVWLEMDRMNAQNMIADAKRRALPPGTIVTPDATEDTNTGSERIRIRKLGTN